MFKILLRADLREYFQIFSSSLVTPLLRATYPEQVSPAGNPARRKAHTSAGAQAVDCYDTRRLRLRIIS